jgi:hypothetical protein
MKPILHDIFDLVRDNWPVISGVVYEIVARVIPTKRNLSLIENGLKVINLLIKNRRKEDPTDVVDFKDSTINKVFVERDKHIISSMLIGMIMLSSCAMAQNPVNATAVRLVNVTDSTTVTSNAATLNPQNFTIFYNRQSGKPRMYYGGVGFDIATSSGSGGNVTGTFAAGQLPFATGTHALTSNNTLLWNNTSKTMDIFNSGLTNALSFTPNGISHTGGTLAISNAVNNDINLAIAGSGRINLLNGGTGMAITPSNGSITAPGFNVTTTSNGGMFFDTSSGTGSISFATGSSGTMNLISGNTIHMESPNLIEIGSQTGNVTIDAFLDLTQTVGGVTNINSTGGATIRSDDFVGLEFPTTGATESVYVLDQNVDITSSALISMSSPAVTITSPAVTISALAGSGTRVVTANPSGLFGTTTIPTIAGSNTQIQYNNSGAFGASSNFTFNSATSVQTIGSGASSSGVVIGSLATNTTPTLTLNGDSGGTDLIATLNRNSLAFTTGASLQSSYTSTGITTANATTFAIQPASNGNLNVITAGTGIISLSSSSDARLFNSGTNMGVFVTGGTNGDITVDGLSSASGRYFIITTGSLPTSCAGAPSGALWNNAGALSICP